MGIKEVVTIDQEQDRFCLRFTAKAPLETILAALINVYSTNVAEVHSIPTSMGKRKTQQETYFLSAGPFSIETLKPKETFEQDKETTDCVYVAKTPETTIQEFEKFRAYLATKVISTPKT